MKTLFKLAPLGAAVACAWAQPCAAQGVATERELAPVVVTGTRSPLDPNLPASTFSTTRESLAGQSLVNTEDALVYAPSTTVRKRFIGDRNANLGGRSFGTTQPARGLAYVDGYLISNFLGRFDAPRWSMAAPEEIARVDVLYGPFSAIYPGNSIGTTVAITTRNPTEFEASGGVQVYRQTHDAYGLKRDYSNNQESAFVGHRWGDLSVTVGLNRLSYQSQPMGYATATRQSGGVGGLPVVTGAVVENDPTNVQRAVVGATGMQTGVQEQAKIKLAYDFTPQLQADMVYAHWQNDYRVGAQSLLHDASTGAEVWKGSGNTDVNINGVRYRLPTMAPEKGEEEHEQIGARLRTRHATGWNQSIQLSSYRMLGSDLLTSNVSEPISGGTVAGKETDGAGTGWRTFEVQATYTPGAGEQHALTFGYHQNNYTLKNRTYSLSDWHDATTRTGETANYLGKTEIKAVYAQDAWRFHPDWLATLGVRFEQFRAYDGSQFDSAASATPQVDYADRKISGTSPKLSLSYVLTDEWMVRGSVGRGIRFPTVSELFQGTRSSTTIYNNDPNLKPERSDAKELAFIRELGSSSLRVSLFEDDIQDAIFRQTGTQGATTVQTVQNVQHVLTRGIELAYQGADVWIKGLDLQGSMTFADAKTLENPAVPESEGKNWPRVPEFRASVLGVYRSGPWSTSLGVRHEGTQYGELDNSDVNGNTAGGVSSYTFVDAKLGYSVNKQVRAAIGVDNLTDRLAFVGPHPYPGRTIYAELKLGY